MEYQYLRGSGAVLDGRSEQYRPPAPMPNWTERLISGPPVQGQRQLKDLPRRNIPSQLLALVPESVAREQLVIPVEAHGRELFLAAAKTNDIAAHDQLRFILNCDVRLISAPRHEIQAAINRHYGKTECEAVDSMLCEFTETAIDFDDADAGPALRRVRGLGAYAGAPSASCPAASSQLYSLKVSRPQPPRPISRGGSSMLFYTVDEGQRALMTNLDGTVSVLVGPRRVWRGWRRFEAMQHHVAHPGELLIVKFRDGHEEHLAGPADLWFDPRLHEMIVKQDCLQIAAKEAVVAYRQDFGLERVTSRRIIYGPALFTPEPGEWLHTFSWHASRGGSEGVKKVPNGLVFQKLWLMPDQMYHDVPDVRTADDAVLTIRLMIFFELTDIERMLVNTHDPIGDFVNAATADVVEFTGKHDFESFKHNTERLNDLATYKTLVGRAAQSGYRIHNVVYRGYGAADSLQQMHNQAIEARTKLQLERATEEQAQDLENFKLESQMSRAEKRRVEQTAEARHLVELAREKAEADLAIRERQQESQRQQKLSDSRAQADMERVLHEEQQTFYNRLRELGVDLTSFLTQNRADSVIELRGGGPAQPHLHLEKNGVKNKSA